MPDPVVYPHIRRTKTPLRVSLLVAGEPLDLTGYTIRAGLEKDRAGTAALSSAVFREFPCTGHGTAGTLSATIPYTGINFTGPATLRVFRAGTPRQFLGESIQFHVHEIGTRFVP